MKYINEYSDYEQKLINQGEPYYFVANLLKDLEIKYHERYPDSIFFINKETGEVWMEQDNENDEMWVSREHIWSKVKDRFSYKGSKIRTLISFVVNLIFKIDAGMILLMTEEYSQRWRVIRFDFTNENNSYEENLLNQGNKYYKLFNFIKNLKRSDSEYFILFSNEGNYTFHPIKYIKAEAILYIDTMALIEVMGTTFKDSILKTTIKLLMKEIHDLDIQYIELI